MTVIVNYGDISPAVAAYSVVRMLDRAMPYLCFEKFGQTYPLPTNSTQTAKFPARASALPSKAFSPPAMTRPNQGNHPHGYLYL